MQQQRRSAWQRWAAAARGEARTCGSCHYGDRMNAERVYCCRLPPQVLSFAQEQLPDGTMRTDSNVASPLVSHLFRCGEYRRS